MPYTRKSTVKSSAPFARSHEACNKWTRTVIVGPKRVTVKPFNGKIYVHINDPEREKSVTFTRDNYTTLVAKMPRIGALINECDLFMRKESQQRKTARPKFAPSPPQAEEEDDEDELETEGEGEENVFD